MGSTGVSLPPMADQLVVRPANSAASWLRVTCRTPVPEPITTPSASSPSGVANQSLSGSREPIART